MRESAVLVLFGEGEDGPELLLTERGHQMRSQPGQVSFPGGGLEPGETAVEAALREAQEETGLDPAGVDVVTTLPRLWIPPRNYAVAPVIGYWSSPSEVRVVDPVEVHSVFSESVAGLVDPDNRFTVRHPSGWNGPGWMVGPDKDVLLWGFTAGIVDALLRFLGWSQDWDRSVHRPLPEDLIDRGLRERFDEHP